MDGATNEQVTCDNVIVQSVEYSWYNGGTSDDSAEVERLFNDYEKANKTFLHNYEKDHGWSWSPYQS